MDGAHLDATLDFFIFFFFIPNSEENHYGLRRKCRMAKSTSEIILIETGHDLRVFR